ncbi:ABC transporter ATP-binding protein [Paenibacillus sp. JSM ZJ436]|uniref:Putative iron(III) dicitrate ABC transporter, ATP-binding protein FecE n=1 Tax=Paenibacillus algicola TaxID=2565926 RepID=A0A4P8XND4_9BACL|nr:ABC transporter ATP-binding protein [Paenibacillus algicola]QCT03943.1 putative iron(III) dicitrate ABC transporter, ATP-binding protein FecE [Paenibacillus algicola]
MITLEGAGRRYGEVMALQPLDWQVQAGEWWGVIGPNGSGKSTLLQLLSGVEAPSCGTVTVAGRNIRKHSRKELARFIAVLQQEGLPATSFTVREVLEMGRYPFQGWLGREPHDPAPLLDSIMEKLDLLVLQNRPVDELSGGQRQRTALGKVMAQQPTLLLLDEPTTYLDIRYQLQFMEMVSQWRQESGITIISVLHDLNLAAQFCDKLLLLQDGRAAGAGPPQDMLTEERLREIFGVDTSIVSHPSNGSPQVLLTASPREAQKRE